MNNDLINIKMETTTNKSLSARIKRRNAQGFNGVGHHVVEQRHSPIGDYRDPKQNHKEQSRDASVQDAINYLKPDERDKANGETMFSHIGSKSRHTILANYNRLRHINKA